MTTTLVVFGGVAAGVLAGRTNDGGPALRTALRRPSRKKKRPLEGAAAILVANSGSRMRENLAAGIAAFRNVGIVRSVGVIVIAIGVGSVGVGHSITVARAIAGAVRITRPIGVTGIITSAVCVAGAIPIARAVAITSAVGVTSAIAIGGLHRPGR